MKEIWQDNSREVEGKTRFDAVFILPAYPIPEKSIGFSLEGVAERLAYLPKTKHASGLLFDTRLRNLAAVFLVKNNIGRNIYTMSDAIRSWMRPYSELTMEHLSVHLSDNEMNRVKSEEFSYDTYSELVVASEISLEMGYKQVAFIADSVHKKRIVDILEEEKQRIKDMHGDQTILPEFKVLTMEEILMNEEYTKNRSKEFSRIIKKLHRSPYWKFWQVREWVSRSIDQRLLTDVSYKTRKNKRPF